MTKRKKRPRSSMCFGTSASGKTVATTRSSSVSTAASNAEAAIARLRDKPGLVDFPDGFEVDDYPIERDHWTEGFGVCFDAVEVCKE